MGSYVAHSFYWSTISQLFLFFFFTYLILSINYRAIYVNLIADHCYYFYNLSFYLAFNKVYKVIF